MHESDRSASIRDHDRHSRWSRFGDGFGDNDLEFTLQHFDILRRTDQFAGPDRGFEALSDGFADILVILFSRQPNDDCGAAVRSTRGATKAFHHRPIDLASLRRHSGSERIVVRYASTRQCTEDGDSQERQLGIEERSEEISERVRLEVLAQRHLRSDAVQMQLGMDLRQQTHIRSGTVRHFPKRFVLELFLRVGYG